MLGPNQQKWVDALKSGEFEQGTQYLCKEGKYCCLGVLAVIAGCSTSKTRDNIIVFDGQIGTVPLTAMNYVGLKNPTGHTGDQSLARYNDSGKTFKEIADIIEAGADELFNEPK